jgi:hypothetical protein
MSVLNTSYKVQADVNTDAERLAYNIENGAYVTTESGVWTVQNGNWVKLYPSGGQGSGVGWARYDDDTYTAENKLNLVQDVSTVLTNNASNIVKSETSINYYNPLTSKILADKKDELYMVTVIFKYSAHNANQTFLRLQLEGGNVTPYERLGNDISLGKGNDVTHEFHQVFQYYVDQSFVDNGSQWKVTATGGVASIWDIIFFISKIQGY